MLPGQHYWDYNCLQEVDPSSGLGRGLIMFREFRWLRVLGAKCRAGIQGIHGERAYLVVASFIRRYMCMRC